MMAEGSRATWSGRRSWGLSSSRGNGEIWPCLRLQLSPQGVSAETGRPRLGCKVPLTPPRWQELPPPPKKPAVCPVLSTLSSEPSSQHLSVWDGDRKSHSPGAMSHYGSPQGRPVARSEGAGPKIGTLATLTRPGSQPDPDPPPGWSASGQVCSATTGLLIALNLRGECWEPNPLSFRSSLGLCADRLTSLPGTLGHRPRRGEGVARRKRVLILGKAKAPGSEEDNSNPSPKPALRPQQ